AVSVAVLLALHLEVVSALDVRVRAPRRAHADHRARVPRLPHLGGPRLLPIALLLLSKGLLPLLLALAARLRGAGRSSALYGGDALPARPTHAASLRLVRGGDLHRAADVGRLPRLPLQGRLRHRGGHDRDVDQRDLPRRLHVLVPLLPARLRRPRDLRPQAARPAVRLALHHQAQRAPPALRVALPLQRGIGRPLYPARVHGRQPRREDPVMENFKSFDYDVLVIGAGGAGLRAAIEA